MKKTFLLLILALVGFTLFADMASTAEPAPRSIGSLLFQTERTDKNESPVTVIPCGNETGKPILVTKGERVNAYSSNRYKFTFLGGEKAEILVWGDGDTDLDLFVYDSAGNLIVKDIGYTDTCYVQWTPSRTETFTIEIKNLGNVWNAYRLEIN